jgi:hypothetical protein
LVNDLRGNGSSPDNEPYLLGNIQPANELYVIKEALSDPISLLGGFTNALQSLRLIRVLVACLVSWDEGDENEGLTTPRALWSLHAQTFLSH